MESHKNQDSSPFKPYENQIQSDGKYLDRVAKHTVVDTIMDLPINLLVIGSLVAAQRTGLIQDGKHLIKLQDSNIESPLENLEELRTKWIRKSSIPKLTQASIDVMKKEPTEFRGIIGGLTFNLEEYDNTTYVDFKTRLINGEEIIYDTNGNEVIKLQKGDYVLRLHYVPDIINGSYVPVLTPIFNFFKEVKLQAQTSTNVDNVIKNTAS